MTESGIQSKLGVIRRNLLRLEQIPQGSIEEFSADFRNVDSALHRLQTAIQALIDVGSYALARLGLDPPRTSRDVVDSLEAAGHLPPGSSARFGPMFGFRNRVVHLYDQVDERIVYRLLTEERAEIASLADALLAILEEAEP